MPHPAEHKSAARAINPSEAVELAETLRALGSASRLQLLLSLIDHERTVEQLAATIGLGQSATSHHLRILRALRLVHARKQGRYVYYALHDHHVADLLAAVRHHHEHVYPPATDQLQAALAEERA